MTYEEALSWLRGQRTMASYVPQDPYETFLIRIAQADAAKIQQAYFVAKAHEELAAFAAGRKE